MGGRFWSKPEMTKSRPRPHYHEDYHWHKRRQDIVSRTKKARSLHVVPFILMYHPAWTIMGIGSRLRALCSDVGEAISSCIRPILCYRNPGRHLFIRVRNYAMRRFGEEVGGTNFLVTKY